MNEKEREGKRGKKREREEVEGEDGKVNKDTFNSRQRWLNW